MRHHCTEAIMRTIKLKRPICPESICMLTDKKRKVGPCKFYYHVLLNGKNEPGCWPY